MTEPVLRFAVLGQLRGWHGEVELDLGWPKQRAVLATLLLTPGGVVSRDDLTDAVWGDNPPPSAASLVHTYLGRLRRIVNTDAGILARRVVGTGYAIEPRNLDAERFARHLSDARRLRASDPGRAHEAFIAALALWGGRPLGGVPGPFAELERTRLTECYLTAREDAAELGLALGQPDSLTAELSSLAKAHPLRERLCGLLMLALHHAGRRAEAMAVFRDLRRLLVAELGVEPGLDLQRLHRDILTDAGTASPGAVSGIATGAGGGGAGGRGATAVDPPAAHRLTPRQLPPAPRGFVGRTAELDLLSGLAGAAAQGTATVVVAIDGTAGVGKTALALHWAHRSAEEFPDGQLYVNLRGFDPDGPPLQPGEAVRGFLDALGVAPREVPHDPQAQVGLYRSLVAGRRMLLLLDNARAVEQVRPLLPGSPTATVVVTSRNQLAGLVALDGAVPLTLDLLPDADARNLLASRLGPGRLAAEPRAVNDILTSSARLPLALAIIAARAATHPTFALAALADELATVHARLDALDNGHPATNVRVVFSWSYQRLSTGGRRMFRLLGVHCGPDITAPAAASLAAVSVAEASTRVNELARANLLTEQRPGRFTCHDLLRAYASEVARGGESEGNRFAAVRRGLDHYLHTAYAAALQLGKNRNPIPLAPAGAGVTPERPDGLDAAMAWFTDERAVLLAAIRQSAETGCHAHTWNLAWTVTNFLERRGHWREWVAVEQAAVDAAEHLGDRWRRGEAHQMLASAYLRLARPEQAHLELRRALDMFDILGDEYGLARTHYITARAFEEQGYHRVALHHANRALHLFRAIGNRDGEAGALNGIGWCHAMLGEHRQAVGYCRQALATLEETGDRHGQAATWDSIGYARHHLGEYAQAKSDYRRAIDLYSRLGDRYNEAATLVNLGDTHRAAGDGAAAGWAWRRALRTLQQLDHPDANLVAAKLDTLHPRATRNA
jgi:DNA-binding SARP family transcriptional activator/tetratricopeptide (TPR) repeat protein